MWLVLAEDGDESATWVAQQLQLRGLNPLRLVTGAELASSARWCYRHDATGPRTELRLSDGVVVDSLAVRGVVNRLTGWYSAPAPIAGTDIDYAAAEFAALVLAFMNGLHCPVINRAEPTGAAGGPWSPLRWRWEAHLAGLTTYSSGHEAAIPPSPPGQFSTVLGLGGRLLGADDIDPSTAQGCSRLSKARGDSLVQLSLRSDHGRPPAFAYATQLPDLWAWGQPAIDLITEALR